ncbi:MAG TPA: type IX secretion system membrane protein PorP/SprF [Bacteroidia bacterium]|nr:type IX secretion system membrane protein PorP/SprF [Bacteroidia bacterium]
MKTRITLFVLLLISAGTVWAQQLPQYTQFMLNPMALNPAVAGKDEHPEVVSNTRQQWVGVVDAPRTYMLSLNSPIKVQNMGVGLNIYTDIVGPTRRTGISAAYAYHVKFKEDMILSMGLSAGILQWGIDGNKLTIREESDPSLSSVYQTTYVPDFGAGLYFRKTNHYYAGISIPQLYQAPIGLYDPTSKESRVVSHIYLNAGYTFTINEEFKIEPALLLKKVKPASASVEIAARAIYKNEMWAGVTFRSKDAVGVMLGYLYKNYLMIGYSYDFITSSIRKYSSGSHEIVLGLRFNNKQARTWNKPN